MTIKQIFLKIYYFFRNPIYKLYCFIFRPKSFGVKVIVENEGKFLMVKLNYAHKKWTFPGGGLKRNEIFKDAAKRELYEETGIKVSNLEEIGEYTSERNFKKNIVKCFYLKTEILEIKIDNFEIGDFGWFSLDNLPLDSSLAVQNILGVYNNFKKLK